MGAKTISWKLSEHIKEFSLFTFKISLNSEVYLLVPHIVCNTVVCSMTASVTLTLSSILTMSACTVLILFTILSLLLMSHISLITAYPNLLVMNYYSWMYKQGLFYTLLQHNDEAASLNLLFITGLTPNLVYCLSETVLVSRLRPTSIL